MKKLLSFILAITLIALLLPKFIGSIVETEYQAMLKLMNENSAITIKNTKFERNWFGGIAVNEMNFHINNSLLDDITFIVTEQLSFGPITFSNDGIDFALSHSQASISFDSMMVDDEIEKFIAEHVEISGLITYSKNIVTRIHVEETSKQVDGNSFVFRSAFAKFTIEDSKRIFGDVHWDGGEISGAKGALTIGKVSVTFDEKVVRGDIYSGNAISAGRGEMLIDSLHTAGDGQTVDLKNLTLSALAEVKKDLMDFHFNYHVDEIKAADMAFKNANVDLLISNLDINVLQEFNSLFATPNQSDEKEFSQQELTELATLADKLLAKNPVLTLKNLSVEMAEGKIVSELTLSSNKKKFDINNIMTAIGILKLKGKGSAAEAALTKLGVMPMVNGLVDQGLLSRVDGNVTYQVTFENGQLSLNGKVIPL